MRTSKRDHYLVLGVEPTASPEDIQRAHEVLVALYGSDPDARAQFGEIEAAYAVLRDPDKRSRYDLYRGRPLVSARLAHRRSDEQHYATMAQLHRTERRIMIFGAVAALAIAAAVVIHDIIMFSM
jgi:curved DNA-binding protein CbpA